MYQRPGTDLETALKFAEHLNKRSKESREYRARLFREIHTGSTMEKGKDGKIELKAITPQETLAKLIELCMEADHMRRLPPDIINELSDIIEGIDILSTSSKPEADLTPLIEARLTRFRKLVRYVANVAYAKPEHITLDLAAISNLSSNDKRREILG